MSARTRLFKAEGREYFYIQDGRMNLVSTNDSIWIFGDISKYYDGHSLITNKEVVLKTIFDNPKNVRYLLGQAFVVTNNDGVEIITSASSPLIYVDTKDDGCWVFSQDERSFNNRPIPLKDTGFTHQILLRKGEDSIFYDSVISIPPLRILNIYKKKLSWRINLSLFDSSHNICEIDEVYSEVKKVISAYTLTADRKIGLLFSGGVDSLIMSLLTDKTDSYFYFNYNPHYDLEMKLAREFAKKNGRNLTIINRDSSFNAENFISYAKKIYPATIPYKMNFGWKDPSEVDLILSGQNADTFIYGDSFSNSSLRGLCGRTLSRLKSINKRLFYFIFSRTMITGESAKILFADVFNNTSNEHLSVRLSDLVRLLIRYKFSKFDSIKSHSYHDFTNIDGISSTKKLSILQWIKIIKIIKILPNVVQNAHLVSSFTNVQRLFPYSQAAAIEKAFWFRPPFSIILNPKSPSYIFCKKNGVNYFSHVDKINKCLDSLSIKARMRDDSKIISEVYLGLSAVCEKYKICHLLSDATSTQEQLQELRRINYYLFTNG